MPYVFDANRARAADLISLPPGLPGTSCESCQFFQPDYQSTNRNIGFCAHHALRMNVSRRWCCYFWKNPRAPLATPALASRRFRKT